MSIKLKLVLSYLAMLIIPFILSVVAVSAITHMYFGKVRKTYNIEAHSRDFIKNPFETIKKANDVIFEQIKYDINKDPKSFEDKKYLNTLNDSVKSYNSYIAVRKNNDIIYLGNEEDRNIINKNLSQFNSHGEEEIKNFFMGNKPLMIKQQDFYFKDKSQGSVLLVTNVSILFQTLVKAVVIIVFVVIFILVATNGFLTFMVSRSITIPLKELKKGANKIKQGNLDFEVKPHSKDEIGELCIAFEDMRVRLKDSVDKQIQYENNRKELISNISHDLKTPITSIKGYVEGIMDGVADTPKKMDKYIKTIYNKASSMDLLIDELFLYSKLDLNKVPFNFEKVNIEAYLKDCIEEMQFDLEKKNIKINFVCEYMDVNYGVECNELELKAENEMPGSINKPMLVMIDREKLRRVITNIIGNSIKYMGKSHGIIDVALKYDNKYPIIEIRDNGKGISKEALPFVFDRFYRADSSRNTSTGGSGLGLAIAKKIIEEHGGTVWANSEENKGTSVFFSLKKLVNEEGDI